MNDVKPEDAKANPEKVKEISDWILEKGVQSWLDANPETLHVDMFMAIHNVHKQVIMAIAKQWAILGVPKNNTYRMADMTWRKTLRTLRLG